MGLMQSMYEFVSLSQVNHLDDPTTTLAPVVGFEQGRGAGLVALNAAG